MAIKVLREATSQKANKEILDVRLFFCVIIPGPPCLPDGVSMAWKAYLSVRAPYVPTLSTWVFFQVPLTPKDIHVGLILLPVPLTKALGTWNWSSGAALWLVTAPSAAVVTNNPSTASDG